jgi:hypothetical protein
LNDPAVPQTIAVDLGRITSDDELRRDVERAIVQTAKPHDAQPRSVLHTVPGMGKILRLVRRDALHDLGRVPSVQDCASYARVVTCRKASAGPRLGPAGKTIGNAPRTWAFAAAATLCLRNPPHGQPRRPRWEKQHGTGKALTILAQKLARAGYDRRKRNTAFDMASVFRAERRSAGAPAVSLDTHGMRLHPARGIASVTRLGPPRRV